MTDSYYITPTRRRSDYPGVLSTDDRVAIYDQTTIGWLLGIAKAMNGIEHAGYAQLMVLMPYPERVWQFANGQSSDGASKKAFREGMLLIAPELVAGHPDHLTALGVLYGSVRCGLLHSGATMANVALSAGFPRPLEFVDLGGGRWGIKINPHALVDRFAQHHGSFVGALSDPANVGGRGAFVKFFDTTALA